MSTEPQQRETQRGDERFAWITVYVLAGLNLVAFGLLLSRYLFPSITGALLYWYTGAQSGTLLLDGLREQHRRLEILEAAPCDSPEMQRYLRGEIGPLIRGGAPTQSAPPVQGSSPGSSTMTDATPPEQSSTTPPVGSQASPPSQSSSADPPQAPGAPRLTGGDVLPPVKLRGLVDQSVVRVVAPLGPDQISTGTGFAIGPDTIVTNRHVIEQSRDGLFFVTSKYLGAEPVRARLLVTTTNSELGSLDFAVLQIENGKTLTSLNVGDDPQPLDSVVAAGYPGLTIQTDSNEIIPDVVYSQGDVSVVQPQSNGVSLVIHTANISPGSSGGPLVNRCGTVVGVNTFVSNGDESTGRALYSLSGKTLAGFLRGSSIAFNKPSAAECASGAN